MMATVSVGSGSRLASYIRDLIIRDPELSRLEDQRNPPPGVPDKWASACYHKWGRFLFDELPTSPDDFDKAPGLDGPLTFRTNGGCGSEEAPLAGMEGWPQVLGPLRHLVRAVPGARWCSPPDEFHCGLCHPESAEPVPCQDGGWCRTPHHHTVCHGPEQKIRTLNIEVNMSRLPKDRRAIGRAILRLIDHASRSKAVDDVYVAKLRATKPAVFQRALGLYDAWIKGELPRYDRKRKDQVRRDIALIYEAIRRKPYREHQPQPGDLPAFNCPTHGQDDCNAACDSFKSYNRRHLWFLEPVNSGRGMSWRAEVRGDVDAAISATGRKKRPPNR